MHACILQVIEAMVIWFEVGTPSPDDEDAEFSGQSLATVSHLSIETSKENGEGLKPCWNPPKISKLFWVSLLHTNFLTCHKFEFGSFEVL